MSERLAELFGATEQAMTARIFVSVLLHHSPVEETHCRAEREGGSAVSSWQQHPTPAQGTTGHTVTEDGRQSRTDSGRQSHSHRVRPTVTDRQRTTGHTVTEHDRQSRTDRGRQVTQSESTADSHGPTEDTGGGRETGKIDRMLG